MELDLHTELTSALTREPLPRHLRIPTATDTEHNQWANQSNSVDSSEFTVILYANVPTAVNISIIIVQI